MIANSQEKLADSPRLIKVLVLMVVCFNLFGLFLLFNPQVFNNSADVDIVNVR